MCLVYCNVSPHLAAMHTPRAYLVSSQQSSFGAAPAVKVGAGGVVPGFLYMYMTSLTHCAETLSLAKDYARALTVIEDALSRYEATEGALRARLEGAEAAGGGYGEHLHATR